MVLGFRFEGLRAEGLGFRVEGLGFRVSGFGFEVYGFGFRVSGFGFRPQRATPAGDVAMHVAGVSPARERQ